VAFRIDHDPLHNFLVNRGCCHFAQVIGVPSDPRITFPYLLKICASKLGLCAAPAGSRTAMPSLDVPPSSAVASRSNPRRARRTVVAHLSRFPPLALFERLLSARADRVVCRRPKTFTHADMPGLSSENLAHRCSIPEADVERRAIGATQGDADRVPYQGYRAGLSRCVSDGNIIARASGPD
jgi:hypothetical protein